MNVHALQHSALVSASLSADSQSKAQGWGCYIMAFLSRQADIAEPGARG